MYPAARAPGANSNKKRKERDWSGGRSAPKLVQDPTAPRPPPARTPEGRALVPIVPQQSPPPLPPAGSRPRRGKSPAPRIWPRQWGLGGAGLGRSLACKGTKALVLGTPEGTGCVSPCGCLFGPGGTLASRRLRVDLECLFVPVGVDVSDFPTCTCLPRKY